MIRDDHFEVPDSLQGGSGLNDMTVKGVTSLSAGSGAEWAAKSRSLRKIIFLGRIAGAFFVSKEWKKAWPLLLFCLTIQFGAVYVFSLETGINKKLFDALQYKNIAVIPRYAIEFVAVGSFVYSLTYLGVYLENVLEMLWRNRISGLIAEEWLSNDRFYFIERAERVENADQRIAEDVRLVISGVSGIFMGSLRSLYTIVVFTALLIHRSVPVTFHLFGHEITTRYDILLAAYVSSILATGIIFRIGRKLTRLNMRQQHYEADLRFTLVSIRKHAEQIAFMVRGRIEHLRIVTALSSLMHNYFAQQRMGVIVSFSTQIVTHIQRVLPLALTIPRYLAGRMTYGDITQTQSVFGTLSSSLTWLMQMYPMYSETNASFDRLFVLFDAIRMPEEPGIILSRTSNSGISVANLDIRLPGKSKPLVAIGAWSIAPGEKWVITGASGSGKSTLLRALAGLWRIGEGAITLPQDARITFLPQLPYLPHGTLLELMLQTQPPSEEARELCADLLCQFRLPWLVAQLDIGGDWNQRLSPGEQQRFALARAFVSPPDVLILDEATSGLDQNTADTIYANLLARPDLTLISVAHTADIVTLHDKRLHIANGTATISEISETSPVSLLSSNRKF
ncbi:ABC transporter ATP-binding protein/permease [Gluconobacter frateurii]|uniref:ABC transporter ATP-binding protein n=1 Tax=Gluconobacter frateurii NRIC 0228 TaxID=1307946 RepID=A0ABQ0Q935_9PROT|nr:ATP-binding cassette domain-containing protein [Gluconobacter frateurii]GBR09589.1 ABC transporter ATP-binding protein [Gluconobacter frateurii NRIC 0228]GLP91910.1 ABC transporter ATP-binding protein [Gluconobacter frateurii]